jgi:hypothetical protein
MSTALRVHAMCALCVITAHTSSSTAIASDALYVFSAKNETNGQVDLVRMEGNNVVSRTPLGFNVVRGASGSRLAAVGVGVEDRKTHVRSWDLKSGKLLSKSETNLKVEYLPLIIGVAGGLVIDETDNQVLYVGMQFFDAPRKPGRGKEVPPSTRVVAFAAVDLSTGESYKVASPKGAPDCWKWSRVTGAPICPQWSMVKGKLGTRLEDGSFAVYSGASHSFTEVMEIVGIAKQWNDYVPNVGLVKETESWWQILSRDDLTPLDQPIDIDFEPGSERMSAIFKMDNGDFGRWFVARAGDDASDYVVFDVTSHSEVARSRYPLAATMAFRSEDGSQLLLADDKHKKALWANTATSVTSEVDFSWAGLPYLTPVFGK